MPSNGPGLRCAVEHHERVRAVRARATRGRPSRAPARPAGRPRARRGRRARPPRPQRRRGPRPARAAPGSGRRRRAGPGRRSRRGRGARTPAPRLPGSLRASAPGAPRRADPSGSDRGARRGGDRAGAGRVARRELRAERPGDGGGPAALPQPEDRDHRPRPHDRLGLRERRRLYRLEQPGLRPRQRGGEQAAPREFGLGAHSAASTAASASTSSRAAKARRSARAAAKSPGRAVLLLEPGARRDQPGSDSRAAARGSPPATSGERGRLGGAAGLDLRVADGEQLEQRQAKYEQQWKRAQQLDAGLAALPRSPGGPPQRGRRRDRDRPARPSSSGTRTSTRVAPDLRRETSSPRSR